MDKAKRRYQCKNCQKIGAARLPCDHNYCKECLIEHMNEKSQKKPIYDFECPSCNKNIYSEFILAFYMDDEELFDIYETFNRCVFCNKEVPELIQFDCKHKACMKCLYNLIINFIDSGNDFTKANCNKCGVFIKPKYYENLIPNEIFAPFIEKTEAANVKSICVYCKNDAYTKNSIIAKCNKCKGEYCILCDQNHSPDCIAKKNGKKINKDVSPIRDVKKSPDKAEVKNVVQENKPKKYGYGKQSGTGNNSNKKIVIKKPSADKVIKKDEEKNKNDL